MFKSFKRPDDGFHPSTCAYTYFSPKIRALIPRGQGLEVCAYDCGTGS